MGGRKSTVKQSELASPRLPIDDGMQKIGLRIKWPVGNGMRDVRSDFLFLFVVIESLPSPVAWQPGTGRPPIHESIGPLGIGRGLSETAPSPHLSHPSRLELCETWHWQISMDGGVASASNSGRAWWGARSGRRGLGTPRTLSSSWFQPSLGCRGSSTARMDGCHGAIDGDGENRTPQWGVLHSDGASPFCHSEVKAGGHGSRMVPGLVDIRVQYVYL